ncbi:hypothetical protein HRJ45_15475 [Vibrio coralliilyticus]|uniref:hypothetical protein n=1 Tax=Vibrio coralliilyticus TaxID=190893 RepID=UPI00156077BE|nr:hypothetical protein [Vibrio coralliilyticus]NRF26269.1 hypothetical protein [Vibrio coralliilyticus]NRF80512.1 hypothetical protein [Vibrio coralliilyticus]
MIIFNSDSVGSLLKLLLDDTKVSKSYYFNDGSENHKLACFDEVTDLFDVNGCMQSIVTSYQLHFIGGLSLKVKRLGNEYQIVGSLSLNTKNKEESPLAHVAEFHF